MRRFGAIAAVLNLLMLAVDGLHLHHDHIAGYGFLFGTSWAQLLDHNWFGYVHSRWMIALIGYTVILWIPAGYTHPVFGY
jgi:ribonuclease BN (tRNA processing enzyme)